MYRKIILCLLYNIGSFSLSFSQKVALLNTNTQVMDLSHYVTLLEDSLSEFSLQEVIKKKFVPHEEEELNFGFSSSTFWLKLRVKNTSDKAGTLGYQGNQWFLNISYAPLDSVTFYYKTSEGKWNTHLLGDYVSFKNELVYYHTVTIPLNLVPHQTYDFYLKVKTMGSMQIPVTLQSASYFQRNTVITEVLYGMMYGSLLVIMLYNVFLYLVIRDINYLDYCLFIFFFAIVQGGLQGHIRYILGEYTYLSNVILPFSISFACFWATLFSIRFLNTASLLPRWHVFLQIALLTSFLVSLSTWLVSYNVSIIFSTLLLTLMTVMLWWIGIAAWIKGLQVARLYIAAWSAILLGILLVTLKSYNLIQGHYIDFMPQIGSILQVLLLSLALAEQIRVFRKEKNEAQEKTLLIVRENERLITEQNEVLEKKVKERTEELNLQQEKMAEQSQIIKERNLLLEQKSDQIKSSINAAMTIQTAILPQQKEILKLLKDYFVIYRPKDVVSGDFYWITQVYNRKILVVADCTGHGVPGAFMTLIGNRVLDKIIHVERILDAASILRRLHEEIRLVLRQDETHNNSGMDVSLLVVREDETDVLVSFAGAKNGLYYISREGNKIGELKGTRKSIGGLQNESIEFENQEILLPKGSLIYLGSDGFEDQNNIRRQRFGRKRMKHFLWEYKTLPLSEQKEKLEECLEEYMKGTVQRDDILWMGIQL